MFDITAISPDNYVKAKIGEKEIKFGILTFGDFVGVAKYLEENDKPYDIDSVLIWLGSDPLGIMNALTLSAQKFDEETTVAVFQNITVPSIQSLIFKILGYPEKKTEVKETENPQTGGQ